jgi:hypothetical protein
MPTIFLDIQMLLSSTPKTMGNIKSIISNANPTFPGQLDRDRQLCAS